MTLLLLSTRTPPCLPAYAPRGGSGGTPSSTPTRHTSLHCGGALLFPYSCGTHLCVATSRLHRVSPRCSLPLTATATHHPCMQLRRSRAATSDGASGWPANGPFCAAHDTCFVFCLLSFLFCGPLYPCWCGPRISPQAPAADRHTTATLTRGSTQSPKAVHACICLIKCVARDNLRAVQLILSLLQLD